jgi:predicted membrane channel-forming protein YqfA (hemolysin III family)
MDIASFTSTPDSTLLYFIAAIVIVGAWFYLTHIPQKKNSRYPLAGNQLPINHLLRKPARRNR